MDQQQQFELHQQEQPSPFSEMVSDGGGMDFFSMVSGQISVFLEFKSYSGGATYILYVHFTRTKFNISSFFLVPLKE